MANEQPGGEPLSATIGEQLQEKQETEAAARAERDTAGQEEERVERRKAEERAEVLRHVDATGGSPKGWRARRARARERGRTLARARDWIGVCLPAIGAAVIAHGLVTRRPHRSLLGLPLVAAVLVLRNRLPAR